MSLARVDKDSLAHLAETQAALLRAVYRVMSRDEDGRAQADIEGLATFHRAVVQRFPADGEAGQ